ncbi:MAG: COX15/CtaA family protein [Thermoanaerobaculia bacterium]|nr:COX15/CtaA family protein [Thermoanaerobaculia bacterium]
MRDAASTPDRSASPRIQRFAWAVLAYNILVILWGAYVRATGSGAGCGSHWPTCNGEIIPRQPSLETLVEFSHRITSGLALLGVLGLLFLAYRRFPKGHRARSAAVASTILIFTEAGIGAGLVLFELVADNESMARALFMGTHLGNTFLLLAAITLTCHWFGGAPAFRWRGDPLAKWAGAAVGAIMLVGISGAVAALGDTLYPAESLLHGLQQDLSPTSHVLIKLRVWHPVLAIVGGLVVLHLVAEIRRAKRPQPVRRWATAVNLLVIVQLAAGALNMVLLVPVWMQLVHLALADALWISLVLLLAWAMAIREAADDGDVTGAAALRASYDSA